MKQRFNFLKLMIYAFSLVFAFSIANTVNAASLLANNLVFSEFESNSEWRSLDSVSMTLDQATKTSGAASYKVAGKTITQDNNYYLIKDATNFDFTNFTNTQLDLYLGSNNNVNTVAIFFVTDGGNYFYSYIGSQSLSSNWNSKSLSKLSFSSSGSPSWNNIKEVWIKVEALSGTLPTVNIDKMVFNVTEKEKPLLPDNLVLSEFEDTQSWDVSPNSVISVDNSKKFSAAGSLKLYADQANATNSYYIYYKAPINYNFQNFQNASLKVYLEDKTQLSTVGLFFMTDNSNYYSYYFGTWEMFNGWNNFTRAKSNFSAVGNPDWSKITGVWIKLEALPGKKPSVNLDKLSINNTGKAKVLFTFDDASQSVRDFAYPILDKNGFKATTWANKLLTTESASNKPGKYLDKFMSEKTLKEIYANGWDVGNHTVNHNDSLDTLPIVEVKYEVLENQNWLLGLGFDRSAYHLCYPMGKFDKEITDLIPTLGVKSGRTVVHGLQSLRVEDLYTLRTVAVGRDTDVAYIKALVDDAINTGTTLFFMFHEVVPSPSKSILDDNIKISVNNFEQITNYIKSQSTQNKLEVKTISQWYNEYIKEYPESVTATNVPPTATPTPTPTTPAPATTVPPTTTPTSTTPATTVPPTATPTTPSPTAPNQSKAGVYLYEHINYQGKLIAYSVGGDVSKISKADNDIVSSIRIVGNYTAEIYENNNYGGKKYNIVSDTPDLRNLSFNDMLSSYKVCTTSKPLNTGVYFYEHINYQGKLIAYSVGGDMRKLSKDDNDSVSSIRVVGNYTAEIFDKKKFGGKKYNIVSDTPDLRNLNFNDKLSSYKVNANATTPNQLSAGVYFYEHINYQGKLIAYSNGGDVWQISIDDNNKISSIRIVGDYTAEIFEKYSFGGKKYQIVFDTSNLIELNFNDMVSSYKVNAKTDKPKQVTECVTQVNNNNNNNNIQKDENEEVNPQQKIEVVATPDKNSTLQNGGSGALKRRR